VPIKKSFRLVTLNSNTEVEWIKGCLVTIVKVSLKKRKVKIVSPLQMLKVKITELRKKKHFIYTSMFTIHKKLCTFTPPLSKKKNFEWGIEVVVFCVSNREYKCASSFFSQRNTCAIFHFCIASE
jgi:hypothetical protein